MTRRVFMTSSPTLWQRRKPLGMHSVFTRVLCVAIALGGLLVAAYLLCTSLTPAITASEYCTPAMPYAPYGGVCTGGWGNSCTIGLACSPVPGVQGTQNPNGYTPCTTPGGCS